jgi:hypothetical protein
MSDQEMSNWLERIHREVSEINWRLAKILDELKKQPQIVVYNAATGQPVTSVEAIAEELRKCQR